MDETVLMGREYKTIPTDGFEHKTQLESIINYIIRKYHEYRGSAYSKDFEPNTVLIPIEAYSELEQEFLSNQRVMVNKILGLWTIPFAGIKDVSFVKLDVTERGKRLYYLD